VCARPGQSSRCKHALRETRQQLCILPRNQIYSAAASYFRPHCSRSLLIAIARQSLRAANSAAPKILQSNLCLQNCLPVTARRSWLQHYSTRKSSGYVLGSDRPYVQLLDLLSFRSLNLNRRIRVSTKLSSANPASADSASIACYNRSASVVKTIR